MVFYYINENVKPLRAALAQANAELKAALDKLASLQARLTVRLPSYQTSPPISISHDPRRQPPPLE